MKKSRKQLAALGLAVLLAVSMNMATLAGQWQQDNIGWWYDDNGTYPMNQWKEIDGKQYYFDDQGYMLYDTITPDGYQVGSDGAWIEAATAKTPTDYQKQVMEDTVSPLINSFDFYSNGKAELRTANLTSAQMVNLLGSHINRGFWNGETILFTGAVEKNYQYWFDKASTIKRGGDLYGRTIDENSIVSDNFIIIDGDRISVIGADGDGVAFPHVDSYTIDGNRLTVSLSYTIAYNVEELNTSGKATAVFVVNSDSFFGYSLESLKMN